MLSPPIRVLLADDHQLVRAGLRSLLSAHPDLDLVGEAADGARAVQLALELEPQVILMDLSMPILDGIAATEQVLAQQPEVAIVVLTSFTDPARVRRALAAGAIGYLLKDAAPESVLAGIRSAALGHAPIDPQVARVLLPHATPEPSPASQVGLSPRECQVLQLIGQGLSNRLIAGQLGIAERTVKVHIGNIFRRLGVADRTSAAMWGRDHLPPPREHLG